MSKASLAWDSKEGGSVAGGRDVFNETPGITESETMRTPQEAVKEQMQEEEAQTAVQEQDTKRKNSKDVNNAKGL